MILPILSFIFGCFVGAITYVLVQKKLRKKTDPVITISCEECDQESLSKEWEVTINTQMHFNDLIIRFRSIILSVFVAALGLIFAASKQATITVHDINLLLSIALVFWLSCFILDYFYYHKLLMGAIKHAEKFDNSEFFKKKGLYGLTSRISSEISPPKAKIFIWVFYLFPVAALLTIAVCKEFNLL
jgi:hypothetical protein